MVVCKKARKKKRKTYGSYGTLVAPRKIPNHKVSGLVATFRERIFHVEILGSGPNDVPRGGPGQWEGPDEIAACVALMK